MKVMTTARLKAGQVLTIKSLPTTRFFGKALKVGDKVTLDYYDSGRQYWAVSNGKVGPFYGFTRKNFDVPAMTATKTSVAPVAPCGMTVDAEFIKAAHAAACSEWKQKLEKKFPQVFSKPLKATRITKAPSGGSDIVATIKAEGQKSSIDEKIFIGIGLAPSGYENKCLSLSDFSEFKFELAKDGQCVILVPKKK
jgi:outer membrane protein assembly factor BamB